MIRSAHARPADGPWNALRRTPGNLGFDKSLVEKKPQSAQNQKFEYADAAAADAAQPPAYPDLPKSILPIMPPTMPPPTPRRKLLPPPPDNGDGEKTRCPKDWKDFQRILKDCCQSRFRSCWSRRKICRRFWTGHPPDRKAPERQPRQKVKPEALSA